MSGLSRDILKWIQSLDLSYSVKNVKRDFANGFLVAEIFSRYFKQDIQMHSFDNGTNTSIRTDNWEQLEKFFGLRGFEVTRKEIDAVIHCQMIGQQPAAVPLLIKIFQFLTNKTVQLPPQDEPGYIPPFARPTANNLIRSRMLDSDVLATSDERYAPTAAEEVVEQQNQQLKQDKIDEPERFVPSKKAAHQARVATRKIKNQTFDDTPVVKFASVQIKSLDDESAKKVRTAKQQLQQQPPREDTGARGPSRLAGG